MKKFSGKLHVNFPRPEAERRNSDSQVVHDVHTEPAQGTEPEAEWNMFVIASMLSTLYVILITTLGIVLPLSLFLVPSYTFKDNGAYVVVFQFYVYLGGLAVLGYMWLMSHNLARLGRKETHATMGSCHLEEGEMAPPLYEGVEEVNFFLRMGLVAFSMGGGLMEGFRMMSYAEKDSVRMWHCFGPAYLILAIIRLIFLITQTYLIFKHHRVVLNYNHSTVKWCIAHLLATNLCTWSQTVILEANESYHHAQALSSGHRRRAAPAPPSEYDIQNGTDYQGPPSCNSFPETLSTVAAPYLFPFIIEYSLLAAAILYNMSSRIGPEEYRELQELLEERCEEMKRNQRTARSKEPVESLFEGAACSKAHTGLFSGISVLILLGVATCFFLYFKTSYGSFTLVTGMIHIISDMVVTIITGVAICLAFWKTHRLFFTAHLDNMLDQNLLILALFGYYILLVFIAIAALAQTTKPGLYGKGASMIGAMAVLDIIQVTMLVLFIVDGLRRRAITEQQATEKPGRSLVTFLLVSNLGLWLVNTFMLKESYGFQTFSGYYGDLAWIIILNLTLPLAIYFRFHAAVCLSEIWLHSYKKVSLHKVVHREMHKCGKIL